MTFVLLTAIIAVATFFRLIKWRLLSRALYAAGAVLFIAIGTGAIPKYLLTNLQSPARTEHIDWGKSNVIVLLGGGTDKILDAGGIEVGSFAYGRLAKTAALYGFCKRTGEQCKVIVSGGDPLHFGTAEAIVYGIYLQDLGIAKTDLILEDQSKNTWQNAQFTAHLISALFKQEDTASAKRILLVTSGFHMRRSLLYFNHFGIHAQPVRADYVSTASTWFPMASNFWATDVALHEYVDIWRYQLYSRLGWNTGAGKQ